MITLKQFIDKYIGRKVDYDGYYGAQCMDLYRFYVKEVLELPQTPRVPGAYKVWDTATADFEKIKNTPNGVPQPGDIMIWNEGIGKNGHIGIVTEANVNSFKVFEQNSPPGGACRIGTYTYNHVIGWIRAKKQIINPPPQMTVHKILVLLNGVQPNILTVLKQAVEHVKSRVAGLGPISIEVDYLVIDRVFNTQTGTSTDGNTIAFVWPNEIGEEGRKGEILLSKEFDLVCLVYDPTKVVGPPPTNPVENPVTIEGFNINQIPTTWLAADFGSSVQFFYHEMLHSWFYIVNSEMNAGQPDTVHTYGGPTGPGHPTQEDIWADFDSKALSLKPWWPALANAAAAPEERTSMLAFEYKGTVYLAIFAKFVPVGDQDTFLELGGNWNAVKSLTDAEFNSIVKPYLAKKTVIA